ncbi:MAG: L-serine ammonia-lyase, iron-sulfur-dependent, subunit alpha [Rhodothermales bacterium]
MMATALLGEPLHNALVEFDEHGAWAPNYEEQGTVLGMDGGLLGIDITDEQIIDGRAIAAARQIEITYQVSRFPTDHANTVRLTLTGELGARLVLVAVSLGGGMCEIRLFNGRRVSLFGGYYEWLGTLSQALSMPQQARLEATLSPHPASVAQVQDKLLHVRSPEPLSNEVLAVLEQVDGFTSSVTCVPVLPIISGREGTFPFITYQDMIATEAYSTNTLGELGLAYEAARSGLDEATLLDKMTNLMGLIEASIAKGLAGTEYADRILPQQSHRIATAEAEGRLPTTGLVNRLIENITAIMESKSAMHIIVAAPTAGGCGALGGTIKAVADANEFSAEAKVKSYFAAGLVGVFFAQGPGFSAEEGGCQLETGAAAAMAAAALADLNGGTAHHAVAAASMALQNTIGLVCDPVADRVEVPCLGKNVTAGMNALAASTMALAGFNAVIPLDEVIDTVASVAASMPRSLCCTGFGGLAATPTSAKLKADLQARCAC